jgi:hypothetical protein
MTKSIKPLILLLMYLTISSCNQNKVDSFLNDYEKVIVKWEEKSNEGKLSSSDVNDMYADYEKLLAKGKEDEEKLKEATPEQQVRTAQLSARMTALITKYPIGSGSE